MIVIAIIYYFSGKFSFYPISLKEFNIYWVGTWVFLSLSTLFFNEITSFIILIIIGIILIVIKIYTNVKEG